MTVHWTKMTLFRQRQYGESDAVVNYPVERLRGKELSEVSSNYLQRTEVLSATILRGQNPAQMHAADLGSGFFPSGASNHSPDLHSVAK